MVFGIFSKKEGKKDEDFERYKQAVINKISAKAKLMMQKTKIGTNVTRVDHKGNITENLYIKYRQAKEELRNLAIKGYKY